MATLGCPSGHLQSGYGEIRPPVRDPIRLEMESVDCVSKRKSEWAVEELGPWLLIGCDCF